MNTVTGIEWWMLRMLWCSDGEVVVNTVTGIEGWMLRMLWCSDGEVVVFDGFMNKHIYLGIKVPTVLVLSRSARYDVN